MNPLLKDLIGFESSGQNVTNTRQSTSSGRARGYFQITDGTWHDFGKRVGIDFSKYPTALSAPYHLQAQVASLIPLKRWDKITLNRLSAAGHKFDINKTLGENLAARGESINAGSPGAPLPAAAAVVTGAGQPQQSYASPETPIPGATQPNVGPGSDHSGEGLASAFDGALGDFGGGAAGGNGLGTSGGFGEAPLDAAGDLRTKGPEVGSAEWDALQAKGLSPLAELFALPTIGRPKPGENIAAKSWI